MALRRTWSLGLRSILRRAVPAPFDCTAFPPSFSTKVDLNAGGAETKKKTKYPSSVKKVEDHSEPDPDSLLIKSLKRQLKHTTKLVKNFQLDVRGSFKPFEVVPNNGHSDLTLRRVFGKEEILIKCLLNLEDPVVEGHEKSASDNESSGSDDSDDLRISQRVTMNVQISKSSSEEDKPRIAFLCSFAKGEQVTIEDIAYLVKPLDDNIPYSGPYYPDLNSNLKQVFQNVVKSRGINSSLAETIMEHLTNQYQNEYLDWLKKVGDFLAR